MREIKFRMWSKAIPNKNEAMSPGASLKEWVYGYSKSDISMDPLGEKNAIIMQFTGLKDKNGKEIYEGDLINIYATDFSHKFPERIDDIFKAHRLVGQSETHWEIIGNIYENPELLKTNE